jgi:nitrogen fixation NifU-like protein
MAMEGNDWVYSETVKDHFLNPRNFLMGDESKFDYDAVGLVGNPICGDQMKMYIKVKDNTIADIRWKTYG